MSLECPNCREPVSFLRTFRTPAWGRFACKACGSILGISVGRRILGIGLWVAVLAFLLLVARIQVYGMIGFLATLLLCMPVIFYLADDVVLVDRRAFTCRRCGYSLENLPEARCPECGTSFDPRERECILQRIASARPLPKFRWATVFAILLLALLLAANLYTYFVWGKQASPAAAAPTIAPAPAAEPP